MEKFINSKVSLFCVTARNLNNVATAVKCRKKFEPGRTLYLTHPEMFGIHCTEKSDICTTCKEPLKIHVLPLPFNMTYSNYINEIKSSFDELIKKVNSFLNAESAFAILPPFPPTFFPLKDTEHDLYHKTGKGRKSYYFTTSSTLLGFESLYAELSKQMILFTLSELNKIDIASQYITEYFEITESWDSYLHVEMQTDGLQAEKHTVKYNLWFEHIKKFLLDMLKLSFSENLTINATDKKESENIHVEPTGEQKMENAIIKAANKKSEKVITKATGEKASENIIASNEKDLENTRIGPTSEKEHKIISVKSSSKNVIIKATGEKASENISASSKKYNENIIIEATSEKECEIISVKTSNENISAKLTDEKENENVIIKAMVDEKSSENISASSENIIIEPTIEKECETSVNISSEEVSESISVKSSSEIAVSRPDIEDSQASSEIRDDSSDILDEILKDVPVFDEDSEPEINFSDNDEILPNIPVYDISDSESEINSSDNDETFLKKSDSFISVSDKLVTTSEQMVKLKTSQLLEDSKDNICHLKILLANNVAKKVIGFNGEALQKLQKDTNSKITISKEGEYYPRTCKRVCLITGTVNKVLKTLFFIIDIQNPTSYVNVYRVKFVVPDSTARIIFEKGNVEQIQKKSKAYIQMCRKKDYPSPNESYFVVKSFDVENIKNAFLQILQYIVLDPENGSCSSISYPRDLPSSSSDKILKKKGITKDRIVEKTSPILLENSKDDICHLKILLESEAAKIVNEKVLQKLHKNTNSRVTVSKEYFPRGLQHVCLMVGTVYEMLKALSLIIDIGNIKPLCINDYRIKFVVPDSTARLITGKKENLDQIQRRSKTLICMYRKEDYPFPNESTFVVKSCDVKNIRRAFSLILQYIALDPKNGSCSRISYSPVLPASGSNKTSQKKDSLLKRKRVENSKPSRLTLENFKEDNICQFIILLERLAAKAVVGVNGEAIVQLQNDTNSEIRVSKTIKNLPGKCDHACSLTGTVDAVLIALLLIIDIKKTMPGCEVKMLFVVPDSTARLIIGKNKKTIEQIKKESKAYIRMYRKEDYPSPNVSFFAVTSFEIEFIKTAFSLIFKHIAQDLENGASNYVPFPNVSLQALLQDLNSVEPPNIKDSSLKSKRVEISKPSRLTLENFKEDNICQFIIFLDRLAAKAVVGANGEAIVQLQNDTNSEITVSKTINNLPGNCDHACSLTGTVDAVLIALLLIIDIKKTMPGCEVKMLFVVPDSTARLIIGKNEETIEQIKKESKAYIRMYRKEDYPSPNVSFFAVTSFEIEFIKTAFSLIFKHIAQDLENGASNYVTFPNVSLQALLQDLNSVAPPNIKDVSKDPSSSAVSQEILAKNSQSCSGSGNSNDGKRSRSHSRSPSRNKKSCLDSRDSSFGKGSPETSSKFCHQERTKIDNEFSLIGALALLEIVSVKCGELNEIIQNFTINIRSQLEVDRSNALRLIGEGSNILLLRMTLNKLESCIVSASSEEFEIVLKALEWTNYLLEHILKGEDPEKNSNPFENRDISSHYNYQIRDEFSVSGALDLLERVCDKCGVLSEMIRAFTTSIKYELQIDQCKALRLIKDDNILLLKMTINTLESYMPSAPMNEIGILWKAVEWTKFLMEYVEKADNSERNIDLRSVADTSFSETPDFILNLMQPSLLYEGIMNPRKEEIIEALMKVARGFQ